MREKLTNTARLDEEMSRAALDAVVACSPNTVFYTSGALVVAQRKTSPNFASRLVEDRFAFVVVPRREAPTLLLSQEEYTPAAVEAWARDIRCYSPHQQPPVEALAGILRERGLASARVGVEKRYITAEQLERLEQLLPAARIEACDDLFDVVRAVKTEGEIIQLKRAANATEEAILGAFRTGRVGETEKDMADRMVANVLRLGAEGPYGMVLGSGENVTHVHNHPGPRRLQDGDLIHVDFGGKFDGYASDLARMAVVGFPSQRRRDKYATLWEAYRGTIKGIRPGMRACDVFDLCRVEFDKVGAEFNRVHVGHSFSLGGHDNPMLQPSEQMVLERNMTLCIEPSLQDGADRYHIEDIVRLTEGEPELLSDFSSTESLFAIV
jgi:Xaa-Pro aminopeptidase